MKRNFELSFSDVDVLKDSLELLLSRRRWQLCGSYPEKTRRVFFRDAVHIKVLILRLENYGR